jgi:hypothetical protein
MRKWPIYYSTTPHTARYRLEKNNIYMGEYSTYAIHYIEHFTARKSKGNGLRYIPGSLECKL